MERVLGSAEGEAGRKQLFGRTAAIAYLVAGAVAVPANALIEPGSSGVYWMPLIAFVPGLIWLALPWERMPEWTLHLPIVLGTIGIGAATTAASLSFTAYYIFVAVFAALVFPRAVPIAFHLALVGIALLAPIFAGSHTGTPAILVALLTAPTLVVVASLVGYLVGSLDTAQRTYRALSLQDALTGVGNYRALHETLRHEMPRHARNGRPFALVLIDLDGFKQINDRLGHLEGDRVLAGVGARLTHAVRAGDLVYRQGGDEFAVLAPETDLEQAGPLCARIRARVAETGAGTWELSASTGCAIFPRDGSDIDTLLAAADSELRAGKRERDAPSPRAA
jgi:diguanylate cyclase (GGDEF)-like protein